MKSAAQILRDARALIDTPEKWWQGDYQCGDRRCMEGAIFHAIQDGAAIEAWEAIYRAVESAIGSQHIPPWNDRKGRTHADVMAAFDKAIAMAEKDVPRA